MNLRYCHWPSHQYTDTRGRYHRGWNSWYDGRTKRGVNAHAVLLVLFQLFGGLHEFAVTWRRLFLANQPWFYCLELHQEIAEFRDQIPDDRKITQRLYPKLVSVARVGR